MLLKRNITIVKLIAKCYVSNFLLQKIKMFLLIYNNLKIYVISHSRNNLGFKAIFRANNLHRQQMQKAKS